MFADEHEGESAEERLLQRTRWFNSMVREHPKDVQLWLRFAAFQLEFLPLQRRPNLLPVLEKQSAILSRALSTCGDDATLIDRYMAVAEQRFDTDAAIALWSSVSVGSCACVCQWCDCVVTLVFRSCRYLKNLQDQQLCGCGSSATSRAPKADFLSAKCVQLTPLRSSGHFQAAAV